jgi:hypothetical protein
LRVAAIVLAALGSLLVASPASAAVMRTEFFGIVEGPVLDDLDMATMKNLRVQTDRFLVNWGWIEPKKGNYKWGPPDRFIGDLAAHGIRAAPSVWGNPSWIPGSPPPRRSAAPLLSSSGGSSSRPW